MKYVRQDQVIRVSWNLVIQLCFVSFSASPDRLLLLPQGVLLRIGRETSIPSFEPPSGDGDPEKEGGYESHPDSVTPGEGEDSVRGLVYCVADGGDDDAVDEEDDGGEEGGEDAYAEYDHGLKPRRFVTSAEHIKGIKVN